MPHSCVENLQFKKGCPDCPYSECIGVQCRILNADVNVAFQAIEQVKVKGLLLKPKSESGILWRA